MRKLYVLIVVALISLKVDAQNFEFGIGGGTGILKSDISDDSYDFGFNPYATVFLRNNYSAKFSFRFFAAATQYEVSDAQVERNYSASILTAEGGFMAEWFFLGHSLAQSSKFPGAFSPYLGLGVGVSYYDTELELGETSPAIHPRDRQIEFPGFSPLVNAAIGFKYDIGNITVGLEAQAKYHGTDKMDGLNFTVDRLSRESSLSAALLVTYQFAHWKKNRLERNK